MVEISRQRHLGKHSENLLLSRNCEAILEW